MATLASGADLPLRHHVHALPRAHPDDAVPAGGRGLRGDRDQPARVAGGKRALEPHLPRRARSRCSRSAPPSAAAKAARCRPIGAGRRRSPRSTSSVDHARRAARVPERRVDHARPERRWTRRTSRTATRPSWTRTTSPASFNYAFRLPRSVSRLAEAGAQLGLLPPDGGPDLPRAGRRGPVCIVISDVRRREMRGGLDTDLLQTLSGGLQVGLLGQRRAAPEPAHLADLDHRLVPAVAVRRRLPVTARRRRRRVDFACRAGFHPAPCADSPAALLALLLVRLPEEAAMPREFDGASAFRYIETAGGVRAADSRDRGARRVPRRGSTACSAQRADTRRRAALDPRDRDGRLAAAHQLHRPVPVPPPPSGCCSWRTGTAGPSPTAPPRPTRPSRCPAPTTAARAWPCCSAWPTCSGARRPSIGVDLLFVDGEDYGDFTKTPKRRADRLALLRGPPRARPAAALRRALRPRGRQGPPDLPGRELAGRRARGGRAGVGHGARPGLRRHVHGDAEAHPDRRSPGAAEGGHPRHRRGRLRLPRRGTPRTTPSTR